ncbi:MAG: DUF4328 domain-containing protein [Planctomycetota bacterium]
MVAEHDDRPGEASSGRDEVPDVWSPPTASSRYESVVAGRARILLVALVVYALAAVASGASSLHSYVMVRRELDDGGVEPSQREFTVAVELWTAIGFGVVAIGTTILFARWILSASRDAHRTAQFPMKYTPGWAVGWYFVPFANLVVPCQVMAELFRVAAPKHGPERLSGSARPLIAAWWTMWLLSSVLSRVSMRFDPESIEELSDSARIDMASSAVEIVLAVVAMALVRNLTDRLVAVRRERDEARGRPAVA